MNIFAKKELLPVAIAVVSVSLIQIGGCNATKRSTDATTLSSASPTTTPSPLVVSQASPTATNWYSYQSGDGAYTASFPAKPQEQRQKVSAANKQIDFVLVNHIDPVNKRFYATTVSNIPVPPGTKINVEKSLNTARDSAAKNASAKIIKETKITLNGYQGREITIQGQNKIAGKQRMFVDPKKVKLYQAVIVAEDGDLNFPEGQKFLDSFKIN